MYRFLKRRKLLRLIFIPVAVILGLLLVSGGTELVLRLFGWWSLREGRIDYKNITAADMVILCVGDSHTEGVGAPAGYDYPRQLAARLRESHRRTRFAVVNLGHAGFNSSQAANRVVDFIAHMPRRPTVIIFNAGKNNDHDFSDARILPEEARGMNRIDQFKYLLANSRAFRLGQITVSRLKDQVFFGAPLRDSAWNKVLDVYGGPEQELLRQWIQRDLDYLWKKTADRNIPLVLLNYWHKVPTVDEVFAKNGRRPRMYFLNIIDFASRLFRYKPTRALVSADYHPNQYGYAIIARLVEKALADNRLIPPE